VEISEVDTVITGHATTTMSDARFVRSNPVMTWADLREYAEFTRDFVMAAQAAIKAGKIPDEATRSLELPAKYKDYNMANAKADVERVYEELKR